MCRTVCLASEVFASLGISDLTRDALSASPRYGAVYQSTPTFCHNFVERSVNFFYRSDS